MMSWSRVVLSPTDGWAVESVKSCCHLYAVDLVFSRYEGRGSSLNGVDAIPIRLPSRFKEFDCFGSFPREPPTVIF